MTDKEFDDVVQQVKDRKAATEFPGAGHGRDIYEAHGAHTEFGEAGH